MSTSAPPPRPMAARRLPALGGFNLTFLALEIRRLLRNKRTVIFALIMPVAFYLLLYRNGRHGVTTSEGVPLDAYAMVSLAVYGAMIASTAGGAMVAVERALGWSRQLRLTPLRAPAYMAIKILTAMVLGLMSVVVVFVAAVFTGVNEPATIWIASGLLAWAGALVFAAFGLFMGYLLPSENVMQIIGPILAMLALFGGLFVPLSVFGSTFQTIAKFTPVYGIGELARSPLVGSGFTLTSVANVVAWAVVFITGAALLFRRDTRRV